MRAFLSHSSKNKALVKAVFDSLGSALAEFDERTFENGQFNVEAIQAGISRCELFVLFATPESLASGYVELEARLAQEGYAQKKIKKIVTYCLGDVRPEALPGLLPSISAVRRITSAGPIARSIRSSLLDISIEKGITGYPFVGREEDKRIVSEKLSDPTSHTPVAIMFSGVDGVGRRTLAKKIFEDIYPHLPKVQPSINVIQGSGTPEIFRDLLSVGSAHSKAELLREVSDFDSLTPEDQSNRIARMILDISKEDQILFVVDDGGLLADDGSLNHAFKDVLQKLSNKSLSHPAVCFIAFRTPPGKSRERRGVIYHRVEPLSPRDTKILVSLYFKRRKVPCQANQVEQIVDLIDGHPYNLEYLLELLETTSLESLLGDPEDLLAFKARQGDEFLGKIHLNETESSTLSILRVLGSTPLQILSEVTETDPEALGRALRSLEEQHCVERSGDVVQINRPLRSAIEQSPQLALSKSEVSRIRVRAVEIFKSFKDDDDVPVSLISTAARAAALSNDEDHYLRIFISPANSVVVARKFYDAKNYDDCEKMCRRALAQVRLITSEATLEARRLQCLSLIRLGRDDPFFKAIATIQQDSKKGKALRQFLLGFRQRIRGYPAEACDFFKKSLEFNPQSFSALREISHALLAQNDHEAAKTYCDNALKIAPTNPYILDQALAIEISRVGKVDEYIFYNPEIESLLGRLKRYGNQDGLSFYEIRMSDLFRRMGNLDAALDHIDNAKSLNPSHVPAYLIECEIHLSRGQDPNSVNAKLDLIRPMIDGNRSGEGNTNLPEFLTLKIRVLSESGKLKDAVNLLRSTQDRLGGRVQDLKRQLSFNVGELHTLSPEDQEFLRR